MLSETRHRRHRDEWNLVFAFADVLAEHEELILDADLLPAERPRIVAAFDKCIRDCEEWLRANPTTDSNHDANKDLSFLRPSRIRVYDFHKIELEDRLAVAEANCGPRLSDIKLILKSIGPKDPRHTKAIADARHAIQLFAKYMRLSHEQYQRDQTRLG